MHINNNSMDEIINKTKLDENQIVEIIKKSEKQIIKKSEKQIIKTKKTIPINIENELLEIKEQIKNINTNIDLILKALLLK